MMTLNCIIIDDEPLARKGLREYIADMDFLRLTGEYDTAMKVMGVLEDNNIHLMFLDIQMPKLTGLEFLKSLPHPPLVVITTAYPQYALEGFELDVLDYLVKPFSFTRFAKAAIKAKDYYARKLQAGVLAGGDGDKEDYIFIKADAKLVKIFYEDILFAEAQQNYVLIHTKLKKYMAYLTFKAVEDNLPVSRFLKVHKSYIVHLSKIGGIEGNEIIIGEHRIPVSRTNREEIMQKILSGRFLKR
jgi:DNA-binding LytR/AlgR family response regulator